MNNLLKLSIMKANEDKRNRVNLNDVNSAIKQSGGRYNMPAAYFSNDHSGYYAKGSPELTARSNFITDSNGVLRLDNNNTVSGPNLFPHAVGGRTQRGGRYNMPAAYFSNDHSGYYAKGSPELSRPSSFDTGSNGVLRSDNNNIVSGPNLYAYSVGGGSSSSCSGSGKKYNNISFTPGAHKVLFGGSGCTKKSRRKSGRRKSGGRK